MENASRPSKRPHYPVAQNQTKPCMPPTKEKSTREATKQFQNFAVGSHLI